MGSGTVVEAWSGVWNVSVKPGDAPSPRIPIREAVLIVFFAAPTNGPFARMNRP
jgi:hypothetical protein